MKEAKSIGERARMFKYVDGDLYWAERPISDFSTQRGYRVYNSRFLGKKAGTRHNAGYWSINICNSIFLSHRIIWEMHHGPIPKGLEIDHIDMDRSNSRIENLRLATKMQNGHNSLRFNKPGSLRGVTFDKRRKKKPYSSRFTALDGSSIYLGTYATAEEAHEVWRKVAKDIGGEFVRM